MTHHIRPSPVRFDGSEAHKLRRWVEIGAMAVMAGSFLGGSGLAHGSEGTWSASHWLEPGRPTTESPLCRTLAANARAEP